MSLIGLGLGGSAAEFLGLGFLPGAAAPGASAAQIWAYVLPNGKSAKQTLVEVHAMLLDLHLVHGLTLGSPLTVTAASRAAGAVAQTIAEASGTVTVTRSP